jgi:hypothetical protein
MLERTFAIFSKSFISAFPEVELITRKHHISQSHSKENNGCLDYEKH